MGKKLLWLVVSTLMALSLVAAACGTSTPTTSTNQSTPPSSTPVSTPTATQPTTTPPTQTPTVEPTSVPGQTGEVKPSWPSLPQYGGTLTLVGSDPTGGWDPTKAQAIRTSGMQYNSNELLGGDWTKGPQGTGETSWEYGFLGDSTLEAAELAESWELKDDGTIIYHLHHGIKYHNKPPVNGREMTAADVVWNMEMQFNYPTAWQTMTYPPTHPDTVTGQVLPGDPRRPTAFIAVDKYTVEVKCPPASQAIMFLEIGDNAYVNPPELWTAKGATGVTSWDKAVGSGPFIATNYVPGSLLEYSAFKDYFEEDPLFPGYKWPYINTIKLLIIPDTSTRQAAFRTGKIDMMTFTLEDWKQMYSQHPELQFVKRIGTTYALTGRMDKQDLPYKDLRVRQALNMAVDKASYLKNFLSGDGEMNAFPYPPGKAWSKFYTPLDQQPPEVQELFQYNPEKAKQLLKDAGYPTGFKAIVNMQSTAARVDEMSIIKNDLAKVGIDLTLKTMEAGPYSIMDNANSQEDMWYGSARGIWAPHEQLTTKAGVYSNDAMINDPYYANVGTIIARDLVKDPANYFKTMKAEGTYELASAWGIFMPAPYNYAAWWPWVANYYGINWTGWANISDWYKGIWIDQPLKKSMGY